jgi:hypothetical protein
MAVPRIFATQLAGNVPASYLDEDFAYLQTEVVTLQDDVLAQQNGLTSLKSYGAVGNSVTDDTAAINTALAAGVRLTGGGLTYAVTGNITLPDNTWLQDAGFIQLDPENANRCTLITTSIHDTLTLIRVKVNRNGTPASISTLNGSAGISITGDISNPSLKVYLEDVEVYGDGPGFGIAVYDAKSVIFIRPNIHDMAWHALADPGTEQLEGFGCLRVDTVYVEDPTVSRLMGWYGSNKLRAYQSDGMGFGGINGATIIGGRITFVGEGYDSSGTFLDKNIWFYGTTFEDIGSHTYKPASVRDSGIVGGRIIRAGLSGLLAGTNVNFPASRIGQNNVHHNCLVEDVGANHDWGGGYGIFIDTDGVGTPPTGIVFNDITVIANEASVTGAIDGTTLTVTEITSGRVVQGQFIAGAGVTAGTYIVETGEAASIIGSITGTTLTVSSTHYGTIVAGQVIYGPGVTTGTTIVSGSGPYTISAAPRYTLTNVAMLLKKEGATADITGSIAATTLTVTASTGTIVVGQSVSGAGVTAGTYIVSGTGPTYIVNNSQTVGSEEMTLVLYSYTVSASQTIASEALTMTSNMDYGVRVEVGMEDVADFNNIKISGSAIADWHGAPTRVTTWDSNNNLTIRGGVSVPADLIGDLTRSIQFDNTGFFARHDDNADDTLLTLQNYGITQAGDGLSIGWVFGSSHASIAAAGTLDVLATGVWSSVASTQTTRMVGRIARTGGLSAAFTAALDTFTVPGVLTGVSSTVVASGNITQAWVKASATADLGVYYGTGNPSFSAAKGSIYSRTDASIATARLWTNSDGGTTWVFATMSG